MSNNGKAKIFYHEIMVFWHNTVLQCGKNGRGQVNIFWHVLRAVYCLLGQKNPSYAPAMYRVAKLVIKLAIAVCGVESNVVFSWEF